MRSTQRQSQSKWRHAVAAGALALGCAALTACSQSATGNDPQSLDDLVITDPSFSFATSRSAVLELRPAGVASAPKAVEISDAEGRRLMKGAFVGAVSLDLKLPVGAERRVKVRVGSGADATEMDVALDEAGHASATY